MKYKTFVNFICQVEREFECESISEAQRRAEMSVRKLPHFKRLIQSATAEVSSEGD